MMRPLFLLAVSVLFYCLSPQKAFSQCCSPGNPVAGANQTGILLPNTLRTVTFYRLSYSDTYFEQDHQAEYQGSMARYHYLGEIIGYGLPLKFTLELELGYFIEKMQDNELAGLHKTYGLSNGLLSLKYGFLKTPKQYELTGAVGFKFPFTRKSMTDTLGIAYPPEIQPSTGAFGFVGQLYFAKGFLPVKMKMILLNRYEVNGKNADLYHFGAALYSSLFVSKTLFQHFVVMLQLRNEYRWKDKQYYETDEGTEDFLWMTGTGGDILYLAPQVSYSFPKGWSVSINCDVPVYRYYNGLQIGPKISGGISLIKDFNFN